MTEDETLEEIRSEITTRTNYWDDLLEDRAEHVVYGLILGHIRDDILPKTLTIKDMRFKLTKMIEDLEN